MDTSVLLDREFVLSGAELERAVSFGDSSRLRRQVARLMEGARQGVGAAEAQDSSAACAPCRSVNERALDE